MHSQADLAHITFGIIAIALVLFGLLTRLRLVYMVNLDFPHGSITTWANSFLCRNRVGNEGFHMWGELWYKTASYKPVDLVASSKSFPLWQDPPNLFTRLIILTRSRMFNITKQVGFGVVMIVGSLILHSSLRYSSTCFCGCCTLFILKNVVS